MNGIGPGDFQLSVYWPDPIEFATFPVLVGDLDLTLDAIVSTEPIPAPEPGTLGLLGLGLAGLGLGRGRQA